MRPPENLCRISPSRVPHRSFQLRPGKPLQLRSLSEVLRKRQCLGMAPAFVLSVIGLLEGPGLREGLQSECDEVCVAEMRGGAVRDCLRPGRTEGAFHTSHSEACLPPRSNTMTSLFYSYRKPSECQPQQFPVIQSKQPPLLSPRG